MLNKYLEMLEKQNLSNSEVISVPFCFEPEIQIKEENEALDISYDGIRIKEEVEDTGGFNEVEEVLEFEDIKVGKENFSGESSQVDNESNQNCLRSDFVQKTNEEAQQTVRKRWSSLLNKVHEFSNDPVNPECLECRKCCLNFKTKEDLLNHEENHEEKYFECTQCHKIFFKEFSLKVHQGHHGALRRHKCNTCGKTFTRKFTLTDHLLSHSGRKPYQCHICKKFYRSKQSLSQHFRYHLQNLKYECPVCKKFFCQPSDLSVHLTAHKKVKDYKCEICNKHFSYESSLRRHIKAHSGTLMYPCDECEKFFKHDSSLRVHKKIKHLGLKPFKCEDCDKSFTTAWSLKLHMNIHRVLQIPNTIQIISKEKFG